MTLCVCVCVCVCVWVCACVRARVCVLESPINRRISVCNVFEPEPFISLSLSLSLSPSLPLSSPVPLTPTRPYVGSRKEERRMVGMKEGKKGKKKKGKKRGRSCFGCPRPLVVKKGCVVSTLFPIVFVFSLVLPLLPFLLLLLLPPPPPPPPSLSPLPYLLCFITLSDSVM